MDFKNTKDFLITNDFHPSKKMGQNFLVDENIQKEIINKLNLSKNEWILEIGPGLGAISKYLLNHSSNLILVELDKRLYSYLKSKYQNLIIYNNDILKLDINLLKNDLGFNSIKVVSNIPYHISSKIVLYLIKYEYINQINILVQKEFADHICAKVNDKNYNSFTILIRFYYEYKNIMFVSRNCFIPKPNVDSQFIQLNRINKYVDIDYFKIANLLRIAFSSRRKTLMNNLQNHYDKQRLIQIFNELNFNINTRPQELNNDDYYNLYKILINNE